MKELYSQIGLSPKEFEGKVVVITGAGRGIGRAMAESFAELGAGVVIAELTDDGAKVNKNLRAANYKSLYVRTDVSNEGSVKNLWQATRDYFGRVDILINNAILCPVQSVLEMDIDHWDRVVSVNLRGAFLTCKSFLPDMLSRNSGVIINMISTDAMPSLSAYIASKQGITGFSQSLDAEVSRDGVKVIALAPGMVDTPGIRNVARELAPRLGITQEEFLNVSLHSAYPGLMPVEHAAAAAMYLTSRLADEYHGQVVNGYEILERAGLIKPAAVPEPQAESTEKVPVEMIQQVAGFSDKLVGLLDETHAEFSQLPIFARPMAGSGFKKKAGMSIQDWKFNAAELSKTLRAYAAGEEGAAEKTAAVSAKLMPYLPQLIEYFRGVPAEMARFSRDQEFLKSVAERMAARETTVTALIEGLRSL
ncbi:MAG: SDR family oxidoreductase [Anaerolineaceae bacterium]|nr:SDR family oxidoreductase [Anaerolineaceae bacterium]